MNIFLTKKTPQELWNLMNLDKLDIYKSKHYNDPVWFDYSFTREFYFGISLWLRVYDGFKYGDENESTVSKTIILWVPFFKFIFSFEYIVETETRKPYRGKSPAQIYCEDFFNNKK